jgi:general secretion pathway protein I
MSPREGFSLIELLVALAVFSLATMALLNLSGESVRSVSRVQDRTFGGIVADNIAAEAVLGLGDSAAEGRSMLAGREWRWTRTIEATGVGDMQRVVVRVLDVDGQEASRRVVFRTPHVR